LVNEVAEEKKAGGLFAADVHLDLPDDAQAG
jgi:hypothetical protein